MTTTTTINVDTVCTDADLVEELGDEKELNRILPKDSKDSYPFRKKALEATMKALSRRVPSIHASDIAIVSELRDCVAYGALARIYETNMTQGSSDSLFTKKATMWADKFSAELQALSPTVGDSLRGPTMTMTVHRR